MLLKKLCRHNIYNITFFYPIMWVIGYGSLMDNFTESIYILVKVEGWKRIFNKVASREFWREQALDGEEAVLNVISSPGSYFNGIAYNLDDEQLSSLQEREQDYRLEGVEAIDLKTENGLSALLFVSYERDAAGQQIIRNDVNPIKAYLDVCRRGAYSFGENFGRMFDKTTFLADGKTTIERMVQDDRP